MIYRRVKALCDERNVSIRTLERETGIKNGTIGGWRDHQPTLNRLQAVAGYFQVPLDYFLNTDEVADEKVAEDV